MAAGSLAELAPLVLLSVFFSASSANPSADLGLLAGFIGFTAVVVVVTQRVWGWGPLRDVVRRLASTSSQLRVRLAITFAPAVPPCWSPLRWSCSRLRPSLRAGPQRRWRRAWPWRRKG